MLTLTDIMGILTCENRADDFLRLQKTDGIRRIYHVKRNCIFQTETSFYLLLNLLISLCFSLTLILLIAANDRGTLTVLIAAYAVSIHVIAAFWRFGNPLQ